MPFSLLERFSAREDSLLLVPTATMADHLRHQLVRQGVPLRPKSIQTLAGFLDTWSPLTAAPPALAHLWMERVLDRQRPARFQEVADFPGVVRALTGLFNEVSGSRLPDDVGRLFLDVERELADRGMGPRFARLQAAAKRVTQGEAAVPAHVFWSGFFKLSAAERQLVEALEQRAEALVEDPAANAAPSAQTTLFRTASIECEVEEIAHRILGEAGRGRPFREMAVVLRSRDPYGPLVETTFARFGIPARSYFIDPLASHPVIRFRATLVRAALAGWDNEILLSALRMPASGLGATLAGDILDFVMRDKLPARGWPNTASWNARERLEAAEWASRLRDMRAWEPSPAVMDQAGEDRVRAWRSLAAAERGWSEVLAAAEQAFEGTGRVSLEAFWRHIETALAFEPIRVPDARREVVHVLDAYEARQWSLPVVFVCGLTERHFPQYHREDPIVGDAALRRAGLDTAADREREERALFELVTTRATALTVLSYPQYDDAGQETLPSFFLPSIPIEDIKTRVRPRRAAATTELVCAGSDPPIPKLSASSIETYLQCPFQFFVKKTLRVIERPDAPRDRLDVLLQGTILHEALAEWVAMPILGDAALEDVFERHCKLKNIPHTYRKEAVRLELLRHFRAFTRDRKLQLTGWTSRMEEPFEFTLPGGPVLRGKIDRLEVDPRKRALVIDYKYSNSNNLTKRMKATEAGDAVQAGIYLLAAEQGLGLRPAGMLFCFAKKGVQWGGWHSGIAGLEEIAEARPEAFAELARNAEETARRVFDEVSRGRISVAPKDTAKCAWCDCSDICRVESIAKVKESGA